jgi:endonuclease/exonuclease/phosphatase family metal-dependent hydrolase
VEFRSFDVGGDRDIFATDALGPSRTGLGVPKTFRVRGTAHDDTVGVLQIKVEKADRIYCSNRSRDLPEPAVATEVKKAEFPAEVISVFSLAAFPAGSITGAFVNVGFPLARTCPATHPILLKEELDVWARVMLGDGSGLLTKKATFTYYKTVTVVSYNTWGPGRNIGASAANQVPMLSPLHPDIVLLQEAEPAHANALATILGLPYVYPDDLHGNSIISRFPITTGARWILPALGPQGSRCDSLHSLTRKTVVVGGPCSGADCPTWNLTVYNTHLDTKHALPGVQSEWPTYWEPCDSWANQTAQANAVVEHIGCYNPSFVLGGDMNANTYQYMLNPMHSCWTNAFHALPNRQGFAGPNEHWGYGQMDIDHLFLQGFEVLKTSFFERWPEPCPDCPSASDHAPVATTIKRAGY